MTVQLQPKKAGYRRSGSPLAAQLSSTVRVLRLKRSGWRLSGVGMDSGLRKHFCICIPPIQCTSRGPGLANHTKPGQIMSSETLASNLHPPRAEAQYLLSARRTAIKAHARKQSDQRPVEFGLPLITHSHSLAFGSGEAAQHGRRPGPAGLPWRAGRAARRSTGLYG